ncbi:MAG: hypothetical protein ACK5NC_05220 [Vibrio sp.]
MSDIKMSLTFKDCLHYEDDRYSEHTRFVIFSNDKAQAATWYEDQADSICHAVNNHDRLVEENAKLKADKAELLNQLEIMLDNLDEAHTNTSESSRYEYKVMSDYIDRAHDFIKKHKEPTNGN